MTDINGHPLEPLALSIKHLHPEGFEFSEIDLITDRNNLRKIFNWIRGNSKRKDFRIDLEILGGKTLIM
jgi:hypothetical protein